MKSLLLKLNKQKIQNITLLYISNKPDLCNIQAERIKEMAELNSCKIIFSCPKKFFNQRYLKNSEIVGLDIKDGFERFKIGLQKVETPYIKICSDDDLFFTGSILSCINYLQKNYDYVCCQGLNFAFNRNSNYAFQESEHPSFEEANASKRVCEMLINYGHFFYAVQRTSILKKSVNSLLAVIKNNIIGANLWELGLALLVISHGKCKVLNESYLIREPTPSKPWYNDLVLEKQSENIINLLHCLWIILKNKNEISDEINNAHDLHLWFQYYLFKDTTGMRKNQLSFLNSKKDGFKKTSSKIFYETKDQIFLTKLCNLKNLFFKD